MNIFKKIGYRAFQKCVKQAIAIVKVPTPEVISGAGAIGLLPARIKADGNSSTLIVTDKTMVKLNLLKPLTSGLEAEGVAYEVFDGVVPNPTVENIEDGLKAFKSGNFASLVAFGGGSVIDCAKIIGARFAKPKMPLEKMRGNFKIRTKLPLLYAIPTTAGTGSEATVASVIKDEKTCEKYAINDPCLVPKVAVLDPEITFGLPKAITATTGMDALTHALEAYLSKSTTPYTDRLSIRATSLIFEYLKRACDNGADAEAREKMQLASFDAGCAFTRAFIGYVHAIAHALGGLYGTAHGLANAVILPHVLDKYGSSVTRQLSEMAELIGCCDPDDEWNIKASKFVQAIRDLNASIEIPEKISGINRADFNLIADKALKESHPWYPVPKFLRKEDILDILDKISE